MNKFKKVYIEITNVCNLSCSFCPKTGRDKEFLSIERFKKILEEVKPYTKYIYFHLMGEPLLNRNLEKFLEISYNEGFKVNLTTNGTLIPKVKEVLLNAKALRQINISLHSFEANNNNILFTDYFNNVFDFVKEANENTDIICAMRLWNMDSSTLKGQNDLNNDILAEMGRILGYEGNLSEILERDNKVKIKDRMYLNGAEKFQWPAMNIEPLGDSGFCHGLRDHFGILVDGTVVPCCLDSNGSINLGNIFNESIEEIQKKERYKKLKKSFQDRKPCEALCKSCTFKEKFN